ncbi:uncharacterized protein CIMG_12692 [Coccidioides immitis RS]|uniref:Uncharacterized protein n=1 Tax=Coccidioides immitis (strain RS) TaxID=246410 RepID=A0A0D8JRP9_COCIM|nr:uncharacterized protein CIMG_12692 [Coccidioides immitis RS]KJF60030.1 hypothetical protein CIMG_12692 [Coccidioides immitis RS]
MASAVNRIFKGRKTSYRLLEVLKEPSAYKAAIIPSSLLAFSRILVLAAKPYCSQGRTMGRTEFERRVDYLRGSPTKRKEEDEGKKEDEVCARHREDEDVYIVAAGDAR